MTKEEVQEILDKYNYYLEHSYTDVAFSDSGKAYLIESDKYGEPDSIYIAENKEELDHLIKADIAENVDCVMEVSLEEIGCQLEKYNMKNASTEMETDYKKKMQMVADKMEIMMETIRKVYLEIMK